MSGAGRRGPGGALGAPKVVARGTVLVDPRAAVAKLREFLLPEPTYYVLELLRAAWAGGATAVSVDNDADDLVLTAHGGAPPARELARLLDHLFSAGDRRLRLLALAVNTALGFSPRFVDLYTAAVGEGDEAPPEGHVQRVRWRAAAVSAGDGAHAGGVEVSAVPRPPGLPDAGLRVHVRERFSASVLREYFASEPAEARLLRAMVRAPRGALALRGAALAPKGLAGALCAVPVEAARGELRGELALLGAQEPEANVLELCELGVLLEKRALYELTGARASAEALTPLASAGPDAPPLRALFDADALPTNASRSRVNLEERFGRELARARDAALEALCARALERLAALDAAPPSGDDGVREHDEAVALREALCRLARTGCGEPWPEALAAGRFPSALRALLDAPLVPLATRGYRALRAVATQRKALAVRGPRRLPAQLAPWLPDTLWLPRERPALAALLEPLAFGDAEVAITQAREALERYQRFLAHPPRAPRWQGAESALLLRVPLGQEPFDAGDPSALAPVPAAEAPVGEVVVLASALRSAGGAKGEPDRAGALWFTPFLEGRPMPTQALGEAPFTAEIVLQSSRLRPRPGFDGVQLDEACEELLSVARARLLEGLLVLAEATQARTGLAADDPRARWLGAGLAALDEAARARIVRGALASFADAQGRSTRARRALVALFERSPGLLRGPAFARADGASRFASLAELFAAVEPPPHALLYVRPGRRAARADGRPVLALHEADRALLAALLPSRATLVDYELYAGERDEAALYRSLGALVRAGAGAPLLPLLHGGARAVLSPTRDGGPRRFFTHRGTVVQGGPSVAPRGAPSSYALALDDEGLVPLTTEGSPREPYLTSAAAELAAQAPFELVSALARAYAGDAAAAARLRRAPGAPFDDASARLLLEALAALRELPDEAPVGLAFRTTAGTLRALLDEAPLLALLDARGAPEPCTPAALRARCPDKRRPYPYVTEAPAGVDFDGFHPVLLASSTLEAVVERGVGIKLVDASSSLPARRAERARRLAREALLARPEVPFEFAGALAPALVGRVHSGGSAEVRCAPAPRASDRATVEVHARGRRVFGPAPLPPQLAGPPLGGLPLRIAVRVEAEERFLTEGLDGLSYAGATTLEGLARRALRELLSAIAEAASGTDAGAAGPSAVDDAARALVVNAVAEGALRGAQKLRERLAAAPLWTGPSGAALSALDACAQGKGKALYAAEVARPWLPPPDPRVEPEALVALVPHGQRPARFASMLEELTGQGPRDATRDLSQVQRQRAVLARAGDVVTVPGAAPSAALAARVEALDPSLGVGELRLVPHDEAAPRLRARLWAFAHGVLAREWEFDFPVALHAALESALLEREHLTQPAPPNRVLQRLEELAHKLLAKAAAAPASAALPPWSRGALRWHLLARRTHPATARALPLFEDTTHAPMTLADLEVEETAHRAVRFTTERPSAPCAPVEPERRVVVLAPREVPSLRATRGCEDVTDELRLLQQGRAWAALPPAERIAVRAAPPAGSRRYELRAELDGHEGEVWLLPPAKAPRLRAHWWHQRRPLGESEAAAPWPALLALEEPVFTPNRTGTAPREDGVLDEALRAARKHVRSALRRHLGPPADAHLCALEVIDPRSPAYGRKESRAVGWLWLDEEFAAAGALSVTMPDGALARVDAQWALPGVSRTALPVRGSLWLAPSAGRNASEWRALLDELVAWGYAALLDELARKAPSSPQGPALGHFVRAACSGFLSTPASEAYARGATLPGSMTTLAALRAAARAKGSLREVPEGDLRALTERLTVPASDEPWARWLRERGMLLRAAAEEAPAAVPAARPATPAAAAPRGPAPPSVNDRRAPTAEPAKPSASAEPPRTESTPAVREEPKPAPRAPAPSQLERFAEALLAELRGHGLGRTVLARVYGAALGGREPVRFDADARALAFDTEHPLTRLALATSGRRGVRLLVVAAVGQLNRALRSVTDADEERVLDELLAGLAAER